MCNCTRKPREEQEKDLDEKVKKFHVYEGQTKSVRALYDEIKFLKDDMQDWKSKNKHLEEKERLYEDLVMTANENNRLTGEIQETNKELEDYVKIVEETTDISTFKGSPVSEVKNKTRTLKSFLS